MATETISVHTLSFGQDFSEENLKHLTESSDQHFQSVWHGKCIENSELDIVVIGTFEIIDLPLLIMMWLFSWLSR